MIRKYSFRKLRGVGLVSCVNGMSLLGFTGVLNIELEKK